jgi:glycine hydroxymethyltransferase
MAHVANWIVDVLENPEDEAVRGRVKGQIRELTERFPLYREK